jgi:hypothetical protein
LWRGGRRRGPAAHDKDAYRRENNDSGEDDEPEQDRRFHVVGDSLFAVIGSAL